MFNLIRIYANKKDVISKSVHDRETSVNLPEPVLHSKHMATGAVLRALTVENVPFVLAFRKQNCIHMDKI